MIFNLKFGKIFGTGIQNNIKGQLSITSTEIEINDLGDHYAPPHCVVLLQL